MGTNLVIVVFAVVVIGGMGSIMGAIVTGFGLGVVEGLTKVFYPQASNTVIFVVMAIVLLVKPAGLFGQEPEMASRHRDRAVAHRLAWRWSCSACWLLAAPFFVYPVFLMKALCFALFACAFNLLLGYAGLLSLRPRHVLRLRGLFLRPCRQGLGLAARSSASWPGVPARRCSAWSSAALAIRRQGIYFAMITLALAQMVYFFCVQAPFTGGEDGIQGMPRGTAVRPDRPRTTHGMYYFVLAIFLFGFCAIYRIVHSPFGQVLKAIRENEQRAMSLGYEADATSCCAFVLSAALAGLAGATKAMVFQFATLTDVSLAMSGEVVLMALLGGIGTIIGPVVGAFVVVAMQNYLAFARRVRAGDPGRDLRGHRLAFRKGLVGEFSEWWKARRPTAEPWPIGGVH